MKFSTAIKRMFRKSNYNEYIMISPDGTIHDAGGYAGGHPEWAVNNWQNVGITEEDIDAAGGSPLLAMLNNGWVRVKPQNGVEVGNLDFGKLDLVKQVLSDIARDNPGEELNVDYSAGYGGSTKYVRVPVTMTGRPDFSILERVVG